MYIDSLSELGALPLAQALHRFDPNSIESKKLLNQLQNRKWVALVMDEWIDGVIKSGKQFIKEYSMMFNDVEAFFREVQIQMLTWEAKRTKWFVMVSQIEEVEQYAINKFVTKNPLNILNPSMLYILKENMTWKGSMIEFSIMKA